MNFSVEKLEDCLSGKAGQSLKGRIDHVFSEPPGKVRLPALTIGAFFLERLPIRELPARASWRDKDYECFATPLFVIREAVVHSSAGIVAMDGTVIEETLIHTSEDANGYERRGRSIRLHGSNQRSLRGRHTSLLSGGTESYFHSLIDSVARLAVVRDSAVGPVESLLVPKEALNATQLLNMAGCQQGRMTEIGRSETLLVEELVLPWTVHGQSSYHPCIKPFFATMSDGAGPAASDMPRRVYISRMLAENRRLVNEAELIEALTNIGFSVVTLEALDLAAQIQLFRGADVIVAPHGAGLANLVFARRQTVILEILMDSYVNWCFRHLAAMLGLKYDCVIGRTLGPWSELSPAAHGDQWVVSTPHVVAAAEQLAGQ